MSARPLPASQDKSSRELAPRYKTIQALRLGLGLLVLACKPSATHAAALSEAAAQGRTLFGRNCAHCHGDDARGDEGPSLYNLSKTDARLKQIIQDGIKGEMPRFSPKFDDPEIQALIAYLRTLKD